MPRLFTALEVPRSTTVAMSLLKGGLPGARWIEPENYHITLRFIGDVDDRVADDLCDDFAQIDRSAVQIQFEGLGLFGSKVPRSLYARIKPNSALTALQSDIDRRILRHNVPADMRKFTPHVTLARLKACKMPDVTHYLSERGGFFTPDFVATRFVVLSSRDSIGGGPYAMEADYPLSQSQNADQPFQVNS